MPTEPRLTKKQKKGIAFRTSKGKSKDAWPLAQPPDIPELDAPEELDDEPASASDTLLDPPVLERALHSRKRKRTGVDDKQHEPKFDPGEPSQKKQKKKLAEKATKLEKSGDAKAVTETPHVKDKKFILFVGNLPYTISKEQIQGHFSDCNDPPSIRLLTSKPRSGQPTTAVQAAKSKGCAFLEFTSHAAMQLGIRKHHTELAGRRINVELTAGGGGNSDKRKEKLRDRNRTLDEQRKKTADRSVVQNPKPDAASQAQINAPIRHSTTSGTSQPQHPKTWSITISGGENPKRTKVRGKGKGSGDAKRGRWIPSGANAITVG